MARNRWTDRQKAYLRKKYPRHSNEYCLRGLRRLGYKGALRSIVSYANKRLHLHKSPEFIRAQREECIRTCIEKRGADFAERMRQRALNDPGWWGGRHNNGGNNLPKEVRQEIARKYMHTAEVIEKRRQSRLRTTERERRRLALGLEPLTKIHNIGQKLNHKQCDQRSRMRRECGYVIFSDDHRIYYDAGTRRSERMERTAKEKGLHVYPISERIRFMGQ